MAQFNNLLRASFLALFSLPLPQTLATQSSHVTDPWVIDTFFDISTNDIGNWHGPDEGMFTEYGPGYVRLMPEEVEMSYHTQISRGCFDLTPYQDMYIHISFAGSDKFTISLTQNNEHCASSYSPSPATWDSVEAPRYVQGAGQDIYIPISHFNIDLTLAHSIWLHGFYTKEQVQLFKVEITSDKSNGWDIPEKLPSGTVFLKCKRPNSFAFGIDDGNPEHTQRVMDILEEEEILVTFFTVGNGLVNSEANFTQMYKEMLRRGHQIALHSYSHPRIEGLPTTEDIDYQFSANIRVMKEQLGVESKYFRPPYGVVGARTRHQLASMVQDPYIINWSIDVEDWLWANGDTPEKQLQAFTRDMERGGDLVVMHYMHHSTVDYYKQFFALAREKGKRIMRIDQCLEDPEAPPILYEE